VKAIVEMPTGTMYKYEVDKATNSLRLDRRINIKCPYNYGFVKGTLAQDGDPLDVFIVSDEPIIPLAEVEIEPRFVFICADNGSLDEKIVATIKGDDNPYIGMKRYISDYLSSYKKGFSILSLGSREDALRLIERYKVNGT